MSSSQRIPYRAETASFARSTAPARFSVEREIPCSPEKLFEIFEDAEAWTKWAGLSFVKWTSPKPFREGTTRTVGLGSIEVDEVFLDYVTGEHMSFYFGSGSTGLIAAFVESYDVRRIGESNCHLTWSVGFELAGLARLAQPLAAFALKQQFGAGLAKLERYVKAGPGGK